MVFPCFCHLAVSAGNSIPAGLQLQDKCVRPSATGKRDTYSLSHWLFPYIPAHFPDPHLLSGRLGAAHLTGKYHRWTGEFGMNLWRISHTHKVRGMDWLVDGGGDVAQLHASMGLLSGCCGLDDYAIQSVKVGGKDGRASSARRD